MDDVGTRAGGLVMVDLRSDRSTDPLAHPDRGCAWSGSD